MQPGTAQSPRTPPIPDTATRTWPVASGVQRYWPLLTLAGLMLAVGVALRLALWWSFGVPAGVSPRELLWILPAGVLDDAAEALYLLAAFALYILLVPDRWYRSPANRRVLAAGALLTVCGLLYIAVTEWYFFEEFSARFNLVAVDYLVYPNEVLSDVWAEYPVLKVLCLAAGGALLIVTALRGALLGGTELPTPFGKRRRFAVLYGGLLAVVVMFFQTDTLALSDNRVANELAANGESSFFRSLRTLELDYRRYYPTIDRATALRLLERDLGAGGGRFVALDDGRLDRQFDANPAGLGRLNVVVVASESFGAEFSRLYGSEQDLTPNFDELAQQGVWFSETYASGTRTVRGLEAISSSFPPIPSISILRRPGNEGIATWGRVMRDNGYDTSFIYGGFGYFDNMNYFFAQNGFETIDRQSMENVRFANMWGVSDQDLFAKAARVFDAKHAAGRPFFSIIMTTSNHKPYTFPPGIPGVPESGGGRPAGVRYADFALGEFLREAREHAWFDDTLFVVLADHGARVYGTSEIPLRSYRIPFMLYAPAHLTPRRVDTLTAQIDVAPTVLGLLGLPYRAPFFGHDVITHPEAPTPALVSHNHDVGLYRDGKLVVLGLDKPPATYRYDAATDEYTSIADDLELERLAIAYYQTAFDLFREHEYL